MSVNNYDELVAAIALVLERQSSFTLSGLVAESRAKNLINELNRQDARFVKFATGSIGNLISYTILDK